VSNSNKKIDRNAKYSVQSEKKFVRPVRKAQRADINSIDDFIQGLKDLMNENPKKTSVHLQQGLKPLKEYQAQQKSSGKKAEGYKKNTEKKQSQQKQGKKECRDVKKNRSYSSSSGYSEEMDFPYNSYHTSSSSATGSSGYSSEAESKSGYFGDDYSYEDSSYTDSSYDDSSYEDSSYYDSSYEDSSRQESCYQDSSYQDSSYQDSSYDDSSYQESSYRDSSYDEYSSDSSCYSDSDDSEDESRTSDEDSCTDTVLSLLCQILALQNSLSNEIQRVLTFYMSGMPDVSNSISGILTGVFKNCWYNVKSPSTGTNFIYSIDILQAIEADNTQTTPDIFEMLLEFIDSLGNQNCRCEVDNDDICQNSLMYQLTGIQQTESQLTVNVLDAAFTGYISKVYNGILYMVDSILTPSAVYCIPVCNIIGYEVVYFD